MSEFSTPPGWYADGDGWERRWDGSSWTEERRRRAEPAPETQVRPAGPPPAAPPTASPAGAPAGPPPATPPPAAPQGGPWSPQPPLQGNQPGQYGGGLPPVAAPPSGGPPSYSHVPGGGFAGQPPQTPFGGFNPPPGRKKGGRLWLFVALGVVLAVVLATGATLAVVQPWKDKDGDSSTKDPDPGPENPKVAIQGDVNGDDKGDVIYQVRYDYDNVKEVTALSNGETFETTELAIEPYDRPNDMYFDWDGDGVNEKLTWTFVESGDQITLTSSDKDFPGEQTHTMSLSVLGEYDDIEIQVVNGDFDADGDQDLAVAGPNDKVVDVSVMLNDGEGSFEAPVLWLSIPNAIMDATHIRAGDFDNDGATDIWAELPSEKLTDKDYSDYYSGDRGYALLRSTGEGKTFEAGAVSESSLYADEFLVGDVTGDGTTHIVAVNSNSYDEKLEVAVYDFSKGTLQEVPGFTGSSDVGKRSVEGAALSDVDGDGDGDVVFVVKNYEESRFTGVQVMTSTGAVFDSATVWAETPTCTDNDCGIEFPGNR